MTPVRLTVAMSLAFIAVVVGMFVYSVTRTPVLSDEQLRDLGVFLLPTPRDIAGFELSTHTGEAFTPEDLRGQWSFVFFGFTNCPDICPTSMSVLAQARRQIEERAPEAVDDFQGMLVSVDPERDTREALARYVEAFSPSFLGVRGNRAATARFTTQVNVAFAQVPSEDGGYTVDHSANIVIVNPRGHYVGFAKMPHQADTIADTFLTLRERWG